ncbi:MAG: hypothetical protein ABWZ82_11785 [Candidatus Limnocylindrales bacterium]
MKGSGSLHVYRVEDVPLKEVSGVCLRRGPGGELSLVAIGDRVAVAAWFVQPQDDQAPIEWHRADVAGLEGSRLPKDEPQIEAVCADGAGRVLLLQEWPTRTELIDPVARRVVASLMLDVPDDHPLAESWTDPKGSHGEGAVFLRGAHLLVAKEKDPPALIEFGPPGDVASGFARGQALPPGAEWPIGPGEHRYVALATWMPDRGLAKACADFSDLEIGPDGHLYLLSDKSGSIARLSDLPADGGSVSALASWGIPRLKGKPEGLAFTPSGRPLVALDTRKARHNLVLLEPPIAGA